MTLTCLGLKVKVVRVKSRSSLGSVLTDGRNSTFHCNVISCELARRSERRGAAEASGSGGVHRTHVGVVTRKRMQSVRPRSFEKNCSSIHNSVGVHWSLILHFSSSVRLFQFQLRLDHEDDSHGRPFEEK